jgi:uncharacterized protein YdbL (DUF1318 family)
MQAGYLRISFLSLLAALLLGIASPAMADALDDALRNGQVGETSRGYIAPVKSSSGAITRLVNDINSRRRAEYSSIARRNNLSLQQVESLAASRIIQRAPAGTHYQNASGAWRRK